MRKALFFALSAAALSLTNHSFVSPAMAQGVVPGSTLTAPKATAPRTTARGIKDQAVKGCGNCGLTGRKFNDQWSGAQRVKQQEARTER